MFSKKATPQNTAWDTEYFNLIIRRTLSVVIIRVIIYGFIFRHIDPLIKFCLDLAQGLLVLIEDREHYFSVLGDLFLCLERDLGDFVVFVLGDLLCVSLAGVSEFDYISLMGIVYIYDDLFLARLGIIHTGFGF